MALTYRIDSRERIVYLTIEGEVPYEEFTDSLLEVFRDPDFRPGFNFLSDRRKQTDTPAPDCARKLVGFFQLHAATFSQCKWAGVSIAPAIYGMQRMLSLVAEAESSDVSVEVFHDFEEARAWLLQA